MKQQNKFSGPYIKRKQVDELVKLRFSEVPKYHPDLRGGFVGSYDNVSGRAVIARNQPVWYMLVILFHEEGHHLCYQKKCWCLKTGKLREYHALKHCLKKLLSLKSRSAIPAIKIELEPFVSPPAEKKHIDAYNMLKKTKLFRMAKKLVG